MSIETPILNALICHAKRTLIPLHVPGHKQGRLLPTELTQWMGALARIDLTELPGLDNLQAPEACILESQQLAARAYGAEACLYSVNGSTAGVMAAIAATTGPDDPVLMLNRFHQSAWRGLVLSGAKPVMLPLTFCEATWEFGFPSMAQVEEALDHHPQVRVAFLTSPTYEGRVADVTRFADVLHRRGVCLIVDEAHGAHLGRHPQLPPHSVAAGADIVIQSAHKMLPALTQTGWVLTRSDWYDPVREWLAFLQSTSPSYVLLASLDAAQAWLQSEAENRLDSGLKTMACVAADCAAPWPDPNRDPYKIWIPTGSSLESARLQEALNTAGFMLEYADGFGVLGVERLDVSYRDRSRLIQSTQAWQQDYLGPEARMVDWLPWLSRCSTTDLALTPREVMQSTKRTVPLGHGLGEVLAAPITPYPPGVPIAFPGQIIDPDVLGAIRTCRSLQMSVQGITSDGYIAVLDASAGNQPMR